MPRRNRGTEDAQERLRRESDEGGDRFVSMRLIFRDEVERDVPFQVGGRWDRRANKNLGAFSGTTQKGYVIHFHPGQRKAVEWFATWIAAHRGRRDNPPAMPEFDLEAFQVDTDPAHAYSALFAGGRRAGKSWIAVAFAVAYAIAFPRAIVWLVAAAATDKDLDELRRYVACFCPPEWVESQTTTGWELANGSSIMLKGAYKSEGLKTGEAHFVLLNEGQKMTARTYTVARGAVVDRSGLVLVCANPPVEAGDQQWVTDFAVEARAHTRASVYVHFNSLLNPHIDRRALLSLKADVDERTFRIEVLGEFMGPKDAVAYNWIRLENEKTAPALTTGWGGPRFGSVTEEFLREIEEGDGISHVVGLDVQRFPYIGGPIYEFFGEPTIDRVIAHVTDEVVLEGGDEVDFCDVLREKGYDPSSTLIVCDASGRYQHSRRRSMDQPPPEWHGRGSFDVIRSEGFTRIVPPSRRTKKNPEIVDRVRAFTSLICSGTGVRRLFVDPKLAPHTCKAIREWKTKHGTPSRTQYEAHLGDGASYPIVRFLPRVLRSDPGSGKPGHVDPIVAKVDRPAPAGDAPTLRIVPPTSGPAPSRRRDRWRGY